jgi:hypothetical protein
MPSLMTLHATRARFFPGSSRLNPRTHTQSAISSLSHKQTQASHTSRQTSTTPHRANRLAWVPYHTMSSTTTTMTDHMSTCAQGPPLPAHPRAPPLAAPSSSSSQPHHLTPTSCAQIQTAPCKHTSRRSSPGCCTRSARAATSQAARTGRRARCRRTQSAERARVSRLRRAESGD